MSQGYRKGETGPSLLASFVVVVVFGCYLFAVVLAGRGWGSFYLITFNVAHLSHALAR